MRTWTQRKSPAGIAYIVGLLGVFVAALSLHGGRTEARTTDTAAACQWVEVGQLPRGVWDAGAAFVGDSGVLYVQGGLTHDTAGGAVFAERALLAVDFGGDAGAGTPVPVAAVQVRGQLPAERWGHSAVFADGYEPLSVFWLGGSVSAPPQGAWPAALAGEGAPAQQTLPPQPSSTPRPTATTRPPLADKDVAWFRPSDETWRTNTAWKLPKARMDHASAYVSRNKLLVVQGGRSAQGARGGEGDVYWAVLDESQDLTFIEGEPSNIPDRYGHTMVYDAEGDRLLVFGGTSDGETGMADLWQLSSPRFVLEGGWQELRAAGSAPVARYQHAAVYDPVRYRMVVFGGMAGDKVLSGTWALELDDEADPQWVQIEAEIAGRAAASMVFDTKSGRAILVGGRDQQGHGVRDIMALECSGEVRPTPSGAPSNTPTPTASATSTTEPASPTQPTMSATPSASPSASPSITVQPSPVTPGPTATLEATTVASTSTPTTPAPRPGRNYLTIVFRQPAPVPTPLPSPTPDCTLEGPPEKNDRWVDVRRGLGLCENRAESRSDWTRGSLSPQDTQDAFKVIVRARGTLQADVDVPPDANYDLYFGSVLGDERCEWTEWSAHYDSGHDERLEETVEAGTYCMMVVTSPEHAGGGVRDYYIRWYLR